MSVSQPFQIDAEEVERTSLAPSDIGRWAILITGCYQLFESEDAARRAYVFLMQDVTVR